MSKVPAKNMKGFSTSLFGNIFDDEDYKIELAMNGDEHTLLFKKGSKQLCNEKYENVIAQITAETLPISYFRIMRKAENVLAKEINTKPCFDLYKTILYMVKEVITETILADMDKFADNIYYQAFVEKFTTDDVIENYDSILENAWKKYKESGN